MKQGKQESHASPQPPATYAEMMRKIQANLPHKLTGFTEVQVRDPAVKDTMVIAMDIKVLLTNAIGARLLASGFLQPVKNPKTGLAKDAIDVKVYVEGGKIMVDAERKPEV